MSSDDAATEKVLDTFQEVTPCTTAAQDKHLGMLMLHGDAEREYAYGSAGGQPDTNL